MYHTDIFIPRNNKMPTQAPQWTEFLSCPICYNLFNERLHRPISLGCGHTVCKLCLGKLHQKKCPFDQSLIIRDVEDLPVNFALLQLAGVAIPEENLPSLFGLAEHSEYYISAKRCIEELAILLKPVSSAPGSPPTAVSTTALTPVLSRPMQRKLVTLINCQLMEEEGKARAMRAARSLGERTVTEMILQHQNSQQLSANLWAAVRARGCQFLGPAMQEEVLKLILLALEDGSALSRKVLVLFVVQRLASQYPQASKTAIGHVVQLLYRASCFKVTKREEESSLMQLKEEFRTYEALRREHDSQIVQIATEAGLRISPEQWSSLLYGDTVHKSHMQSIIDKLQTPQSFVQSVNELVIALQRSGDPGNLSRLRAHYELLANIDPCPDAPPPSWENLEAVMKAVKTVVQGLVEFSDNSVGGQRKLEPLLAQGNTKYKTHMCRDLAQKGRCPRGTNCTFAHSQDEMERYRARSKRLGKTTSLSLSPPIKVVTSSALSPQEQEQLAAVARATQDKMFAMSTSVIIPNDSDTTCLSHEKGVNCLNKVSVMVPVMKPSVLPPSAKITPVRQTIYTSPTQTAEENMSYTDLVPITSRVPSMHSQMVESAYGPAALGNQQERPQRQIAPPFSQQMIPPSLPAGYREHNSTPARYLPVPSPGASSGMNYVPTLQTSQQGNVTISSIPHSMDYVPSHAPPGGAVSISPSTPSNTYYNATATYGTQGTKILQPAKNTGHTPLMVSDENTIRTTMALPPNPYTSESFDTPTRDSHYYLTSNIAKFTRGKSPSQQLDELHQRRNKLIAQLSKTNGIAVSGEATVLESAPVAQIQPIQSRVGPSIPSTSTNESLAKSVADSLATAISTMSLADKMSSYTLVSDAGVTPYAHTSTQWSTGDYSCNISQQEQQYVESDMKIYEEDDDMEVYSGAEDFSFPRDEYLVETHWSDGCEQDHIPNIGSHEVDETLSQLYYSDHFEEEDDDEFVPFSHTVVSKYGPISRMAKTKLRGTGPVQVTAAQVNGVTAVTAVTPMKRPFPISTQVPSRFSQAVSENASPTDENSLGALASSPIQNQASVLPTQLPSHDHVADPQGLRVATSLPTALMQPNLIAAANNQEPHTMWAVRERLGLDIGRAATNDASNSGLVNANMNNHSLENTDATQRQQLCHELKKLNLQIENLQLSEDERLARELQAIELNIQETERKIQQGGTVKCEAEKRQQVEQDRRLAQKIVLDEARQRGICVRGEGQGGNSPGEGHLR